MTTPIPGGIDHATRLEIEQAYFTLGKALAAMKIWLASDAEQVLEYSEMKAYLNLINDQMESTSQQLLKIFYVDSPSPNGVGVEPTSPVVGA